MTKARPGHIDLAEVGSDEVGTAEWYPPQRRLDAPASHADFAGTGSPAAAVLPIRVDKNGTRITQALSSD
jgi:hypothetical protein